MSKKRTTKKQSSKLKLPNWLYSIGNIQSEALDRFFNEYSTLENCIAALKELLPQFKHIWYHPPKKSLATDDPSFIREHFYWPIRERLEKLRSNHGANWRPVPATIPELEDWITDITKVPKNLLRTKTILQNFDVTRTTLNRYVKGYKGVKLTDYRPKGHAKNAELILDAAEVARHFRRIEKDSKKPL